MFIGSCELFSLSSFFFGFFLVFFAGGLPWNEGEMDCYHLVGFVLEICIRLLGACLVVLDTTKVA